MPPQRVQLHDIRKIFLLLKILEIKLQLLKLIVLFHNKYESPAEGVEEAVMEGCVEQKGSYATKGRLKGFREAQRPPQSVQRTVCTVYNVQRTAYSEQRTVGTVYQQRPKKQL